MELTSLGHRLEDLLDGYPATLVKGLVQGAGIYRRHLMVERAAAMTVAVAGALDMALNQGRGKVLETWVEEMVSWEPEKREGKARMTERALSFFESLPRKSVKP